MRLKTYGRLSGIKAQNNYNLLTFGDPKVITKLTGGERLKVTDRVGPWALVGHKWGYESNGKSNEKMKGGGILI